MNPHQNEKHRILSDVADLACFQGTISGEKFKQNRMVLVTLPEIEVERGRQWVLVKHAIAASWIRKSKDIYGLMHIADRALKPQTSMDGQQIMKNM